MLCGRCLMIIFIAMCLLAIPLGSYAGSITVTSSVFVPKPQDMCAANHLIDKVKNKNTSFELRDIFVPCKRHDNLYITVSSSKEFNPFGSNEELFAKHCPTHEGYILLGNSVCYVYMDGSYNAIVLIKGHIFMVEGMGKKMNQKRFESYLIVFSSVNLI